MLAALGGWFLFLREESGPESVVKEYISALDNVNVDRANELAHEETPAADAEVTEQELEDEGWGAADVTVERTEIVDQDIQYDASEYDTVQEFEVVETSISAEGVLGAYSSETLIVIVAKNGDGNWKVWDSLNSATRDTEIEVVEDQLGDRVEVTREITEGYDSTMLEGLVTNTGDEPLEVQLVATFYGTDGQFLSDGDWRSGGFANYGEPLPAGESVEYSIRESTPPSGVDRIELEILEG